MAKKERAPKKEKPSDKNKEIFKKTAAERRENRKSNGLNAIITVVVVLLLIGVSTVVGLTVKNSGSDASSSPTEQDRGRTWVMNLIDNYDSTVAYLTGEGYTAGVDFEASYDSRNVAEDGLVGSIKMTKDNGFFEIYYFADTTNDIASNNANVFFAAHITDRTTEDTNLIARKRGNNCFLGKGEVFQNLFWKYYLKG